MKNRGFLNLDRGEFLVVFCMNNGAIKPAEVIRVDVSKDGSIIITGDNVKIKRWEE